MRLFLRNNSLTLVFTVLFLGALLGQSVAGWKVFNEEQLAHDSPTISYARYLVTSHFGEAVIENWQSEYLQFTCFILATVWLVQRGSNESKKPEDAGLESDAKQLIGAHAQQNSPAWAKLGDWRTAIYSNSLLIVMGLLFLGSWFAQSVTAWTEYNSEQREHDESGVSWAGYLARADFWEKTLQNWQSEFLAVATMAIFTVYLRQRGSPESKPVGAPHDQTASSG
jgi:membrane protein implicated in regulation of membrane protease activity